VDIVVPSANVSTPPPPDVSVKLGAVMLLLTVPPLNAVIEAALAAAFASDVAALDADVEALEAYVDALLADEDAAFA
jgi:hypothetical protein